MTLYDCGGGEPQIDFRGRVTESNFHDMITTIVQDDVRDVARRIATHASRAYALRFQVGAYGLSAVRVVRGTHLALARAVKCDIENELREKYNITNVQLDVEHAFTHVDELGATCIMCTAKLIDDTTTTTSE